jgi:hypothetical protein
MEQWEIEARANVQVLHARYIRYVDSGRADELAELFVADCLYDMDGGAVAQGRDAIVPVVEELKAMFVATEGFGRVRHHVSSIFVEFESTDRASGMSYFTAMSGLGADHWGTYRDVIVRAEAGWRFQQRVVRVGGATAGSPIRSWYGAG